MAIYLYFFLMGLLGLF